LTYTHRHKRSDCSSRDESRVGDVNFGEVAETLDVWGCVVQVLEPLNRGDVNRSSMAFVDDFSTGPTAEANREGLQAIIIQRSASRYSPFVYIPPLATLLIHSKFGEIRHRALPYVGHRGLKTIFKQAMYYCKICSGWNNDRR
jgi:hypothetical protein